MRQPSPCRPCSADVKALGPPSAQDGNALKVVQSDNAGSTALAVPDLEVHPELDPLKITMDHVGLVNFMGSDTLEVVLDDLYTYFLSNIGEWDQMFEHFPATARQTPPCSRSKKT